MARGTSRLARESRPLHTRAVLGSQVRRQLPAVRNHTPLAAPPQDGARAASSARSLVQRSPRTVKFASDTVGFLGDLAKCALEAGITFELLLNSDSRHVRHGDEAELRRVLGPTGYLLLSPNVGETVPRGLRIVSTRARHSVRVTSQQSPGHVPSCSNQPRHPPLNSLEGAAPLSFHHST